MRFVQSQVRVRGLEAPANRGHVHTKNTRSLAPHARARRAHRVPPAPERRCAASPPTPVVGARTRSCSRCPAVCARHHRRRRCCRVAAMAFTFPTHVDFAGQGLAERAYQAIIIAATVRAHRGRGGERLPGALVEEAARTGALLRRKARVVCGLRAPSSPPCARARVSPERAQRWRHPSSSTWGASIACVPRVAPTCARSCRCHGRNRHHTPADRRVCGGLPVAGLPAHVFGACVCARAERARLSAGEGVCSARVCVRDAPCGVPVRACVHGAAAPTQPCRHGSRTRGRVALLLQRLAPIRRSHAPHVARLPHRTDKT